MVGTVLIILQIATAVAFVALMAVQTDRAEQSGVMGLGGQGGRMGGTIDMPVGAERILKPLTKWVAVAFLISSLLSAGSAQSPGSIGFAHLGVGILVYIAIMLIGNKVWDSFLRIFGAQS